MSLVNEVISFFIKRRKLRIEEFKKFPIETQSEVFFSLIERARFTEFGLKHNFNSITSIKEFQERVPVVTYEDHYPWIERIMRGEKNILWPSEIKWFSKSSGTTNSRSKFIPVSDESLEECNYRGGKDLLTLYFENRPDSQLFEGKSISIGGSLHANPFHTDALVGDISAIITRNMPSWAEMFRIPPPEIALLDKWEEKMAKMVELCSTENVTSIAGVPTWTVVLIESIIEKMGAKNALEIWPNFEAFFHGAVSFTPYRHLFSEKLFPSDQVKYLETYNASEGFFAIQDDFALKDQMLLMLDYGVFYEFLPMEEWDNEFPKALTLDEVELEKSYAMVISTNGGLWRYKIGDTIKFTSKYPFRIKITGRTKHFINAFGEELMVENADQAIAYASQIAGIDVLDYTAGPIFMDADSKGGHQWVIECSEIPTNCEAFTQNLDKKLKEVNSDYDAKRQNDIALTIPKVHYVKHGTFYQWMEKRGKLGGQNKVPRLSNTREFIDDIIQTFNLN
ncbi:MAG: GH3 auxin-responsive promoter family protein [Cytophagaceae bacterium]|nr:GH3 auxin-responsive promoter family protein [Cytophagaceae bacterium]